MLEVLIVVLVVVLLLGRPPAWSNADPIGLIVTIVLVVILVSLLLGVVGSLHWRY